MNMTKNIIEHSLEEAFNELKGFLADPATVPAIGRGDPTRGLDRLEHIAGCAARTDRQKHIPRLTESLDPPPSWLLTHRTPTGFRRSTSR